MFGTSSYNAAEAAFDRGAEMPLIGGRVETNNAALTGLRRWRVTGFENYLIFYRVTEEAIEIIRVLQTPDIKERLEESDDPAGFTARHRNTLIRLDRANAMQAQLNEYKKRINRLKKMEPNADRAALIEKLKQRRIELIKQFLK